MRYKAATQKCDTKTYLKIKFILSAHMSIPVEIDCDFEASSREV